jgi:hypothetical protein
MSEKIQLTPLPSLDMCNAIQLQKNIRENYAEARRATAPGFLLRHARARPQQEEQRRHFRRVKAATRPAARIAQSPKGARAKLA